VAGRYLIKVSRTVDLNRMRPGFVLGVSVAAILAVSALLARVGADADWLAALGHLIAVRGTVPSGVPFAAAPTGHWPNALVLAELIFAALEHTLGDRGLMLAQLVCVAGAMAVLARDAGRQGADSIGIAAALVLAAVGTLPSLAIARVQMFSLVLFPLLAALLRAQARAPSRRIWLAVPLLALWSNLHGAALLGAGMLLVYLVLERARRDPGTAIGVGLAGVLALSVTPAGIRTVDYYAGVLTNQAAERGQGMWGPLSLTSPLDLIMGLVGVLLAYRAWRARPRVWEAVMAVVLVVLTLKADRDGVWLLFFLAVPAARRLDPSRSLRMLAPPAAAVAVLLLVLALVRGPLPGGASPSLLTGALAVAHGTPVLADGVIDEQVALAGGRIWAGNPIDAFPRSVQVTYLNWLAGERSGAGAVGPAVRVVLVGRGTATQALMARLPDFTLARSDGGTVMYERTG
jgi:hypothetical protein